MSSVEAAKPLNVSPLIKFSRWSLLGLGILYGAFYQKRFSKKEAALREEELRQKPIRDAQKAEERKRQMEAERLMILEWEGKK
ncbi:ATP synthase, subunit E [Megachile rotundata]|uniref:ATP synthase, subunit E n=1 Tax=Megachile rotundata TaxID=143995 RepID=UPI000258F800|nr:PREDICTED: ATP synthase subunit e, mitochondrial [Megachile rotundata]